MACASCAMTRLVRGAVSSLVAAPSASPVVLQVVATTPIPFRRVLLSLSDRERVVSAVWTPDKGLFLLVAARLRGALVRLDEFTRTRHAGQHLLRVGRLTCIGFAALPSPLPRLLAEGERALVRRLILDGKYKDAACLLEETIEQEGGAAVANAFCSCVQEYAPALQNAVASWDDTEAGEVCRLFRGLYLAMFFLRGAEDVQAAGCDAFAAAAGVVAVLEVHYDWWLHEDRSGGPRRYDDDQPLVSPIFLVLSAMHHHPRSARVLCAAAGALHEWPLRAGHYEGMYAVVIDAWFSGEEVIFAAAQEMLEHKVRSSTSCELYAADAAYHQLRDALVCAGALSRVSRLDAVCTSTLSPPPPPVAPPPVAPLAPPVDHFASLPGPLAQAVFALLPVDARLLCVAVCASWRALLSEPGLWSAIDVSSSPTTGVQRFTKNLFRAAVVKAAGRLRSMDGSGRFVARSKSKHFELLRSAAEANAGALRELRVAGAWLIPHQQVETLLAAAPGLALLEACVRCTGMGESHALLRNDAPFGPLRMVDLHVVNTHDNDGVDDDSAVAAFSSALASHTHLHRLTVVNAPLSTTVAASAFAAACAVLSPSLRALKLAACEATPSTLSALARLVEASPKLNELEIDDESVVLFDDAGVTARFCAAARASPGLTRLQLSDGGEEMHADVQEAMTLVNARFG